MQQKISLLTAITMLTMLSVVMRTDDKKLLTPGEIATVRKLIKKTERHNAQKEREQLKQLDRISELEHANEKLTTTVARLEKSMREVKSNNLLKISQAASKFASDIKNEGHTILAMAQTTTIVLTYLGNQYVEKQYGKFLTRCNAALGHTFENLNT